MEAFPIMLFRLATIAVVGCALAAVIPFLVRAEDESKTSSAGSETHEAKHRRVQEIHKKLAELTGRIRELQENNKLAEAEALQREGAALAAELKPLIQAVTEDAKRQRTAEREAEIDKVLQSADRRVRQELEEHLKAGRREEAERAQQMLRAIQERTRAAHAGQEVHEGNRREGAEDVARRAEHLQQAAEHMAAAGFPDQAEQLRRQAASLAARHSDENRGTPNAELRELFTLIRQQNERIERLEQIVQKLVSGSGREEKREKDE